MTLNVPTSFIGTPDPTELTVINISGSPISGTMSETFSSGMGTDVYFGFDACNVSSSATGSGPTLSATATLENCALPTSAIAGASGVVTLGFDAEDYVVGVYAEVVYSPVSSCPAATGLTVGGSLAVRDTPRTTTTCGPSIT